MATFANSEDPDEIAEAKQFSETELHQIWKF